MAGRTTGPITGIRGSGRISLGPSDPLGSVALSLSCAVLGSPFAVDSGRGPLCAFFLCCSSSRRFDSASAPRLAIRPRRSPLEGRYPVAPVVVDSLGPMVLLLVGS